MRYLRQGNATDTTQLTQSSHDCARVLLPPYIVYLSQQRQSCPPGLSLSSGVSSAVFPVPVWWYNIRTTLHHCTSYIHVQEAAHSAVVSFSLRACCTPAISATSSTMPYIGGSRHSSTRGRYVLHHICHTAKDVPHACSMYCM